MMRPLAAAFVVATPAGAVPLPPGALLDFNQGSALDAYEAAPVSPGDPSFFGEPGPSGFAAGRRTEDGFDVVTDLYDVTG